MLPTKLSYFITLAHIENYTKAAEKLNISQPTLSNNISSIEDELGIKLFEKSGRNIVLTKAGKIFLNYVQQSVDLLDEAKIELRKLGSEINAHISVAHVNIQSNKLLPSYLKSFIDSNPSLNTHFDLHIDLCKDIINGLKKDIYDVGFCLKGTNDPSIEFCPLWEEEFVIIVPEEHPLAMKDIVTLEETLDYPHITYSEKSLIYNAVQEYYKELKQYPNVVGTVEVAGAMIGLVSEGVGIGFAPISSVSDKKNIKVLELVGVKTHRMVYLAYDKSKYHLPAVKRFIKYMTDNFQLQ